MKFPTAAKAYMKAQNNDVQIQLEVIADQISLNSSMGYLETNISNWYLLPETENVLRALGYKIYEGHNYVNISWDVRKKDE